MPPELMRYCGLLRIRGGAWYTPYAYFAFGMRETGPLAAQLTPRPDDVIEPYLGIALIFGIVGFFSHF